MKEKSYLNANQKAWEEAYDKATPGFKNIVAKLQENPATFIPQRLLKRLNKNALKEGDIAQLACNNGRELLSLGLYYQARSMTGFDLASNMVDAANQSAQALNANAVFYRRDIQAIEDDFNEQFDAIFILIGVLCWIPDMHQLMQGVQRLLKPGGTLYLYDGHPFTHVFAFPQDEGYIKEYPTLPVHSYFRKEPFVEYDGMEYLTHQAYQSKAPFTSFLYTFEDIFQALIKSNLKLSHFEEGAEDALANFKALDQGPFPLTFYLEATKEGTHAKL